MTWCYLIGGEKVQKQWVVQERQKDHILVADGSNVLKFAGCAECIFVDESQGGPFAERFDL